MNNNIIDRIDSVIESLEMLYNYTSDGVLKNRKQIIENQYKILEEIKLECEK